MNNDLMFSSRKDDWETPQAFFEKLDEEFDFTFDAAANENNSKCASYSKDALNDIWEGRVFCNPPYGRNVTGKFIEKGYEEFMTGISDLIVFLVPARTDTKWFHEYVYGKAEIRFLKGRLKFEINGKPLLDKHGRAMPAPFPSMLVIYK